MQGISIPPTSFHVPSNERKYSVSILLGVNTLHAMILVLANR